jgi:hypothetical protein
MHGRAYDDYRVGIEEAIKSDPKPFFGHVDLKKNRVCYPSVMHFEGHLASGLILYNEHMLMMHGCLLIPDQMSCRITHFLVLFSSL